jgi:RNA polymerase sigma-70 factor (ECF subfamily)
MRSDVTEGLGASAKASSAAQTQVGVTHPDADIIRAIGAGELRRALSFCVREHAASIGRLCLALLGSQAEADQLTEQTLLGAYRRFTERKGESSVRGWLLGIARQHCLEHLAHRRRQPAPLRGVGGGAESSANDEVTPVRQRAQRARQLLERVSASDGHALLLRYLSGLSFRDVGLACGVDEATARQCASRALIELRVALAHEAEDD